MKKLLNIKKNLQTPYREGFVVGLLCFLLFSFQLGNRPFATPDEARYVEIPREMVVSGDFITPRLNGVKYFEKPPLFYWLQAASFKTFGLNEAGMRLWVVFFATLGCVATYAFGRSVFNRSTGLMAAGVLATTALYFSLSRLIILDMAVSVLVTLSLYCFYRGLYAPFIQERQRWFLGLSFFCGLGVLAKGVMALVVPGPLILLWLSYTRQWHFVKPLFFWRCSFLFLLVTVPWHLWVSLKNPEFLHKYFVVEHWLRYTTTIHARYKPAWFFIPIVFIGLMPWTFFLVSTFKTVWHKRTEPLYSFLGIWIGWVLLFFSFSHSKLIPYILPIFPPLALLIANALYQLPHKYNPCRFLYGHSFFMLVIGVFSLALPVIMPDLLQGKHKLLLFIEGMALLLIVHAAVTIFLAKKHNIRGALKGLGLTAVCMTVILGGAAPYVQRPSLKNLVQIIHERGNREDPIISFLTYYQDLPLYSQKKVIVVEAKGELEFGTTVEDTTSWMINNEDFLKQWLEAAQNHKILWAIGRQNDLERFQRQHPNFEYTILCKDQGNILFIPKNADSRKEK